MQANRLNLTKATKYAWFPITVRKQIGDVVQLVRTLPCHGRGRGFESRRPRHSFQSFTEWHFWNLGAIRVQPLPRFSLAANAPAESSRPASPERYDSSSMPPAGTCWSR